MRKADLNKYGLETSEYVVAHALWQKSRGRNPSIGLHRIKNPRKALVFAQQFAYFPATGTYLDGKVPEAYKCADCGATGCKLWREYNTFADYQTLRCAKCAAVDERKDITSIDAEGKTICEGLNGFRSDTIGWLVPAVPTEEGDTYWGYTSVPTPGVKWWKNLPTLPITTAPATSAA
jgi:hypothetical protein